MVWLTGYAATVRIWLAILVTLAACKNHDLETMDEVKRDVCACKDAACAESKMARLEKAPIRSTPKIQAVAHEIMECRARLEEADRPSTDPDAEGSAAGSAADPAAGSAAGSPAANPAAGSGAAPAAGSGASKP